MQQALFIKRHLAKVWAKPFDFNNEIALLHFLSVPMNSGHFAEFYDNFTTAVLYQRGQSIVFRHAFRNPLEKGKATESED